MTKHTIWIEKPTILVKSFCLIFYGINCECVPQSVNGITGCWILRTGWCLQNVNVKNTTTKMPLSYIHRWYLLFYGQKSCYKQEVHPVGFRVATSNSVNRLWFIRWFLWNWDWFWGSQVVQTYRTYLGVVMCSWVRCTLSCWTKHWAWGLLYWFKRGHHKKIRRSPCALPIILLHQSTPDSAGCNKTPR